MKSFKFYEDREDEGMRVYDLDEAELTRLGTDGVILIYFYRPNYPYRPNGTSPADKDVLDFARTAEVGDVMDGPHIVRIKDKNKN